MRCVRDSLEWRRRKGRTILVDCGKDFYRGAVDIFARHGLTTIDAVLLTHGHVCPLGYLPDRADRP